MTAAQTSRGKTSAEKLGALPTAALTDYLETLSERHEQFATTVKETHERASRLASEWTEALFAGQREWLGVARKLASHPTDFSANSKVVMDAAAAAQERSLSLGKLVYGEQTQVGAEARKLFEATFANAGFKPLTSWFAKAE